MDGGGRGNFRIPESFSQGVVGGKFGGGKGGGGAKKVGVVTLKKESVISWQHSGGGR